MIQSILGRALLWMSPLHGGGFKVAYAQLCAFYYISAVLLHHVVPALVPVKSVQQEQRSRGSVARDALYSLGPLAVKAGMWTLVEALHAHGWGLLYDSKVDTTSHVLYLIIVVILLDYLHDGWFYLTHRMLHWKPLYRHIHHIHHKSQTPTAFSGYSFHLVEALIVFFNEVIVCFMFPIHIGLHRVYHIVTTIIHEGGHAGYEIAPFIPTAVGLVCVLVRGPKRAPPAALNTVQHHDMHHRFPNKHFSLYFTHLDRWCGTLHSNYDARVQEHFGKHK